jgi:molybdopterin-guanine dinucleotide biosynthesis protein A
MLLNANGEPCRFAPRPVPVIGDVFPGHGGPLVGILSTMEWAVAHRPDLDLVLSVPGDGPFLPLDLLRRLGDARAASGARIAVAASHGRANPVVALWPVDLATDLRQALVDEGVARVDQWQARYPVVTVPVDEVGIDPLYNVNTPADLAAAERMLRPGGGPA